MSLPWENSVNTECCSGGSSAPVSGATQIGQVLYSVDGSTFTAQLPLTSAQGWLVKLDGILLVKGHP